MVALWNRADHYIFILWFLSIFFLYDDDDDDDDDNDV